MGKRAAELVRALLRSAMLNAPSNTQGNTTNKSAVLDRGVSQNKGALRPPAATSKTKPKRRCVKCKGFGSIHRHHIIYEPEVVVDLCSVCHAKITGLNTKAARVAYSSKIHRKGYTNRLRLVLWNWFINNEWPDKKRISYIEVYRILEKAKFKIELPNYAKK